MKFRAILLKVNSGEHKHEEFTAWSWKEAPLEAIRFADHEWVLVAIHLWQVPGDN